MINRGADIIRHRDDKRLFSIFIIRSIRARPLYALSVLSFSCILYCISVPYHSWDRIFVKFYFDSFSSLIVLL